VFITLVLRNVDRSKNDATRRKQWCLRHGVFNTAAVATSRAQFGLESEGQEVAISVGEKNTSDEEDETVVISNQSISQDEWITDVALWPDKPSRELLDKWAREGSVELQNLNDDLFCQKSVRVQAADEPSGRFCTYQMFFSGK